MIYITHLLNYFYNKLTKKDNIQKSHKSKIDFSKKNIRTLKRKELVKAKLANKQKLSLGERWAILELKYGVKIPIGRI